MSHVLLDTHAWAWSIWEDPRLTLRAREAILQADSIAISTISIYEIGQKMRLGKWAQMASVFSRLEEIAERQGAVFLPVTSATAATAALLEWPHRDPFDRLIAATAIGEMRTLISADEAFDGIMGQNAVSRIW